MSRRAENLSKRIQSFRDEVITFVEQLSEEQWKRFSELFTYSIDSFIVILFKMLTVL